MHRLARPRTRPVWLGPVVSGALLFGLLLASAAAPLQAEESEAVDATVVLARQTLEDAGLTETEGIWQTPSDRRLRSQLRSMEESKRSAEEAQAELDDLVDHQRAIEQEIVRWRRKESQIQTADPNGANPDQQATLARVRAHLARLGKKRMHPHDFAALPRVKSLTIKLLESTNQRYVRGATGAMRVRELQSEYRRIADKKVLVALSELGGRHRLGLDQWGDAAMRKFAAAARDVLPEKAPLYRDGGEWRTSVILQHRYATTVTINEVVTNPPLPSWLPSGVLEAAGIEVSPEAEYRGIILPGGRRIHTRLIRLPYLHIGKHELTSVELLALSPEDEDLGGQLTKQLLQKHQLEIDSGPPSVIVRSD